MYFIYMLRCEDNSIYTGITTDLNNRMREHFLKEDKCAKYTLRHSAIKLERVFQTDNRSNASKLEYHIKRLSKNEKEKLIEDCDIGKYLSNKLESDNYKIYKVKKKDLDFKS